MTRKDLLKLARRAKRQGRKPGRLPRPRPTTGIQLAYWKQINKLVQRAHAFALEYLSFLKPILDANAREDASPGRKANKAIDKASDEFFKTLKQKDLEAMARVAADKTSALSKETVANQMRAGLGVDVFTPDPKLNKLVEGFVTENVALIKSVPNRYFDEVERLAANAVREGRRWEDLARDIQDRTGVAEDRARLIARDQVGKAYSQINDARFQALGAKRFIWRTVHDQRVRPEHAALDGKIFDLGVGDEEEGIPGSQINCRCYAEIYLEDIFEDL